MGKPLSSLRLAECDSNGENVQYDPDNLPIEKPVKTSAFKALAISSHGTLGKDNNTVSQVIVNPFALEAIEAQVSPPRDVISTDLNIEAACATFAIFEVGPDLTSELASYGEV